MKVDLEIIRCAVVRVREAEEREGAERSREAKSGLDREARACYNARAGKRRGSAGELRAEEMEQSSRTEAQAGAEEPGN